MLRSNNHISNYIFFLVLLPCMVQGQTTIWQVVTKKIEKTFPYRPGYEVNVEGEKAEIKVETWDKPEIYIRLELTAKHPEKAVAERDVEKIKYLAERVQRKIYARNYVAEGKDIPKPEASLYAKYLIKVPAECSVYLKDYFGEIDVSNLVNRLRVHSEFTSIGLNNMGGQMDIKTKFGDLVGQGIDGSMKVNSRRSNVTLSELKGQFDIESYFGIIKIFADDQLVDMNIVGEKTDVYLFNTNPNANGYALSAKHGNLKMPKEMNINYVENNLNLKQITFKPSQDFYPSISVSVTFGDIVVQKTPVKP